METQGIATLKGSGEHHRSTEVARLMERRVTLLLVSLLATLVAVFGIAPAADAHDLSKTRFVGSCSYTSEIGHAGVGSYGKVRTTDQDCTELADNAHYYTVNGTFSTGFGLAAWADFPGATTLSVTRTASGASTPYYNDAWVKTGGSWYSYNHFHGSPA